MGSAMFCPYEKRVERSLRPRGRVPRLRSGTDGRGDMFSEEKKEVK